MIWKREDYLDLLTFSQCSRPMITSIWPLLVGLDEEWRKQGASDAEINLTAFDFDYVEYVDCGGVTGAVGGGFSNCLKRQMNIYSHLMLWEEK